MEREWLLVITEMLLLYCLVPGGHGQTMPTGCTYDSGMFECDYSTLDSNGDIPVPAADFSPIPQRLRLINLPSSLTSSIFDSDFAALSTSDYDTNYPATLELKCGNSNSTMSISSPFLDNMGHVQDFRIINCHLGNVPSGAFAELGTLDRFSIENGSIASMNSGLLTGVTIKKDPGASPTFPIHRGEFAMRHTKLSGSLPADFLSGQTYIHTVILDVRILLLYLSGLSLSCFIYHLMQYVQYILLNLLKYVMKMYSEAFLLDIGYVICSKSHIHAIPLVYFWNGYIQSTSK